MDHLMSLMFGQDFFEYTLDAKKTCHVQDDFHPKFRYNREEWLYEYADMVTVSDNGTTVEMGRCLVKQLLVILKYEVWLHLYPG